MELSIVIPTLNEAQNLAILLDKIKEICQGFGCEHEIIVVDAGSKDDTVKIAGEKRVKVFIQQNPGYGGALKDAISLAKGRYIITIDADFSHNPYIIKRLFSARESAHVIIASRYVRGGLANMPVFRLVLSRILNKFLRSALSLPVRDISSGFRLYDSGIFKEIEFKERDFNVLVEILVKAYMKGFLVREIPFHYQPRFKGKSNAKIFSFGMGFLRTLLGMWRVRNSIASADYDDRAFYSRIPMQRFWQRQRYKIICGLTGYQRHILDVGCGTSKIMAAFPQAVGMDINFGKLRFNLSLGNHLVNADIRNICFKDASFEVVICSEVIEHLKDEECIFQELKRVIKPGGTLILGTPDYSRFSWLVIEWLYRKLIPGGYADEHISRYSRRGLVRRIEGMGFKLESYEYILGSELICKFIKVS